MEETYLSIAVTQGVTKAEAKAAAARSTAKYCRVQCCCSLILITSVILMIVRVYRLNLMDR